MLHYISVYNNKLIPENYNNLKIMIVTKDKQILTITNANTITNPITNTIAIS